MERKITLLNMMMSVREATIFQLKKKYYFLELRKYYQYRLVKPYGPADESIYELNPGDTLDFEQAIVGRIQQLDMTFKRVDKPTDSDYYQYTWEKHQLYNEWYTLLWQKIEELKRSVRQQRKRPLNH